jgi:hypothetical protein
VAARGAVAKWELWLATGSLALVIAVQLIGVIIQINTLSNYVGQLQQQRIELVQKDANHEDRISILEGQVKVLQGQISQIQGQICTLDIARNLMHANDLRQTASIWEKVFNARLATDNSYYPTVCTLPTEPR